MCLNAVADMVTSVVANDDSILPGSRKTLCIAIERNQTGNGRYLCAVTIFIYIGRAGCAVTIYIYIYIYICLLYVHNVFYTLLYH